MTENDYCECKLKTAAPQEMNTRRSGPEVIKLCSCSTQLSTKFQLLIKTEVPINEEVTCFKSLRCFYHAYKC